MLDFLLLAFLLPRDVFDALELLQLLHVSVVSKVYGASSEQDINYTRATLFIVAPCEAIKPTFSLPFLFLLLSVTLFVFFFLDWLISPFIVIASPVR